jgi:hypothetical protein
MPETGTLTVEHVLKGIKDSAVGKASGEAGKSTAEAGENKTEKKDKKGMFKSVIGMAASVLGIQVSFAAMLRQSQIATGFFGAIFQVLGAILDSFLLAFAPALFQIVERLASFIPVAREMGEEIAGRVGDLWSKLEEWAQIAVPLLTKIWNVLSGIVEWFSNLSPMMKQILGLLLVIPRLYAFFRVGFFIKMGAVLISKIGLLLATHRVKSAMQKIGSGGGGSPHMMLAGMVVSVVMLLASLGFTNKNKDDKSSTVDVSGQLGKRYLPSQASQLGGTLNEAYSQIIKPFTDVAEPAIQEMGQVIDEYNIVASATTDEFMNLKEALPGVKADWTHLIQTGTDATMNSIAKQEEAQQAILDATDNWVGDIDKNTGAQTDSYHLLLEGTDATAAALDRQAKAIDDANTNWEVGSTQSKNQFVSTASFMHDTAVEMSDKTTNVIAKSFSDEAMGSMTGGLKTFDTNLAMLNQDMTDRNRDLIEAAEKQKEAAIAFQLMTGTVTSSFEENRRLQREHQEEIRDASIMANDKMLSYLSSIY